MLLGNSSILRLSAQSRAISGTPSLSSRFPALVTRISRSAHDKNLKKIAQLRAKLGSKYVPLGRDKRTSPTTERRCSTSPTQAPVVEPPCLMTPLLASKETPVPLNIVPGDLDGTLAKLKELSLAAPSASSSSPSEGTSKSSISAKPKPSLSKTSMESAKLEIPAQVVPPPVTKNVNGEEVHYRKAQGPFYAYALGSPEAEFLFQKTPRALKMHKEEVVSSEEAAEDALKGEEQSKPAIPESLFKGAAMNQGPSSNTSAESVPATITEQAEMIRRMVALENASGRETKKFNVGRVVELLGEMPNDTGSAAVQGVCLLHYRLASE